MPAFDVAAIRAQFPALRRQQDGRPVVFLDGPGGTQVPDRVIDAVAGYYRTMNANSGGSFITSRASDSMAEAAHAAVAAFIGAGSPGEVKFGYNMTTLTFHVSGRSPPPLPPGTRSWSRPSTTRRTSRRGARSPRTRPRRSHGRHPPEDGTLDLDSLQAALGDRTRLVAFRVRLERPGHDQPRGRDRPAGARGRGAHLPGRGAFSPRTARSTCRPSTPTSWSARCTKLVRAAPWGALREGCRAGPPARLQSPARPTIAMRPGRPPSRRTPARSRRSTTSGRSAGVRRGRRRSRRGRRPWRAHGRDGRDRGLRASARPPDAGRPP